MLHDVAKDLALERIAALALLSTRPSVGVSVLPTTRPITDPTATPELKGKGLHLIPPIIWISGERMGLILAISTQLSLPSSRAYAATKQLLGGGKSKGEVLPAGVRYQGRPILAWIWHN
ncbi:MAG TPA: hypothetical protein ENN19_16835 [Chloroflexi bacterium]|nr:hypothetical protein [Chloroflexota bacterium]